MDDIKKLTTSKILDRCGDKAEEQSISTWQERQAYENELQTREPFDHLVRNLDSQAKRIRKLEKMIDALCNHQHSDDGTVTVSIREYQP